MPELLRGFSIRPKKPATPAESDHFLRNPAAAEVVDQLIFPETIYAVKEAVLMFR